METKIVSRVIDFMAGGGEMGKLMRQIDWSQTVLGSIEEWPQSLRTSVSTCLNSRFPILLWWGPEMVMLYNDAYRPMLGVTKHPAAMGQKGRDCWPEIWHIIGPMLEGVLNKGQATWSENQMLPMDRNGYVEECYFTFSYSPIQSEHGIGGIFSAGYETTQQVIAQRRLDLLRMLAEKAVQARSVKAACEISFDILRDSPHDIPYSLIYFYIEDEKRFILCKSTGIENAAACLEYIAVSAEGDAVWPLARVLETRQPYILKNADGIFGPLPGTPWPEPSTTAALVPLMQSDERQIAGVLIAGISPRRNLDEEYLKFLTLVAGQITTTITNAHAYEEERKKAEARTHVSEQLRQVFEQTPAAIAIISRNNYVLEFANDLYLQIIEKGPESIGKSLFDTLPELMNQGIKELLANVMESGQPYSGTEFEVNFDRDGKTDPVYFNFIYHPLRQEDGRISGVIVVCFNVTDLVTSKRRAEESELLLDQKVKERTAELHASHEAMRQQRDFVEKILDSSIDNICVLDRELRYVGFNETCEETYKKTKDEVLGKSVLDVFPDLAGSVFHVSLQKALAGTPVYEPDYQSLITGRHFENNFIPLKDQLGKVYAVLLIAHDNTESIEAARSLKEKNDQLSRTNRELERFAYIASHDLQEPLRKIRTFSSLIERELPANFAAKNYFEKIHASSERMSHLIKDLLNYSSLAGAEVAHETVDLQNVVRNVISDYELLIDETGAKIVCGELPPAKGVPLQLHQLFSNLIGNSLKFARSEPRIEIMARVARSTEMKSYFPTVSGNDYAEIIIRDNGIGFDQKFSEQIFTIFQRLHDRKVSGTGIGLAICSKIVENHRGYIRAEGRVGEGAIFYVYFPND